MSKGSPYMAAREAKGGEALLLDHICTHHTIDSRVQTLQELLQFAAAIIDKQVLHKGRH